MNPFHSPNVPSQYRNVQENPIFITFPGKKRSNWEKIQKQLLRASTADHDLFFQISHIWLTSIFEVSNAPDTFFFYFSWEKQVK